ncbi:MAG: STAS domain-containing protein [Acidimicrobiales bacterium]|jgi:anti-anti-sigma regulatory factor
MDPVLELWIDDNAVPIKVRLAGLLDAHTGAAVRSVIGELLAEGHRDFALEIDGLEQPDASGFSSLVAIQRQIKSVEGSLRWSPGLFAYASVTG